MLTDLVRKLETTAGMVEFTLNAAANAIGTIAGGLTLTLLYFVIGSRLLRPPNINGIWLFKSKVSRTKYNPYRNMELIFKAHLLQDGNRIHGSAEKVYELSDKEILYVGKQRDQLEIEGTIHKSYFGRSHVFLHMRIDGLERSSSGYATLKCKGFSRNARLEGTLSMTAGDSYGLTTWYPVPISLRVDEYRGLPLSWLGRLIDAIAGHFYKDEWKLIESRIQGAQKTAKYVWRTFNCHLLIAALVLAEDHRFYKHGGVDPIGMARALWRYLTSRPLEGGSTIEQQFVRTVTGDYRRSISRKVKEIILAARLHQIADKDTIAVHYLLVAYCGWRMTGMLRSAHRLGIDLKQPTMAEAAAIVARIKFPEPEKHNAVRALKITDRKAYILRKLEQRKFLLF